MVKGNHIQWEVWTDRFKSLIKIGGDFFGLGAVIYFVGRIMRSMRWSPSPIIFRIAAYLFYLSIIIVFIGVILYGFAKVGAKIDNMGNKHSYNKASEMNTSTLEWYNKAKDLYNIGEHEEAIECYYKALKMDPKFAYAWNGIGDAFASLECYEEAIESYDKALNIYPKLNVAWNGKGFALHKLERYSKAIECYDKALEKNPTDEAAKKIEN